MALKRWGWVGGPVLAALLVAVVVLPPQVPTGAHALLGVVWGYGDFVNQAGNGHSQFVNDVTYARQGQRVRLSHAMLSDSIMMAARGPLALRSDDGLVTLIYEAPLVADSARLWLSAVTRELALYPGAPAQGMRLVVALLSDALRLRPGNGFEYSGVRTLLDQAARTGTCVVTVNLLPRLSWGRSAVGHDLYGKPVSRVLGACALYARFGAPGSRVSRWVAAELGYYWWNPLTPELQEARRSVRRYEIPHDVDWNNALYGEVRWLEVGCLRGGAALCLRSAGLGWEPDSPFRYFRNSAFPRNRLIAYLLATGTPEQFAAFWRSSQPVAEALEGAYGRPASMLAMAAFQHWYTAPPSDSSWGGERSALTGLGWIGFALAVAVVAGRRWTTEI